MDYGRLGERRRGMHFPLLEIASAILLLGAIVLTMVELVAYSNQKDSLPTDLTVAGIAVGGLSERDAQARWEAAYVGQPIQLSYNGSPVLLDPADINFRVNSEAMLAEARDQSSREKSFWAGFWNYLERRPVAAVRVPLQASYPQSDLRLYLEGIADRYDAKPDQAGFDLDTLTFHSGTGGRRLDIDQAMVLIDQALYDPIPEHRRIVLPTVDAAAPQRSMETLRDAIIQLTGKMGFTYDGDQTQASVFIMDLKTGETVKILADVPYSAESTIKIPIMVNLFRKELLVTQDEAYLLTESILCSNNAASNYLMQVAGSSDLGFENQLRDGLNQVSCTAQKLGAEHTFISAPLYVGDTKYQFEAAVCRPGTPANTAFNTEADPYSQTTAQDMGVLLSEIYDCANYSSGLMTAYPDDITQTECKQMLNLLSGNRIDRLIELGVPPGTRVAHKNGWGPPGTSGDAGIVFSPGGDYILVVYTHELVNTAEKLPTIASWELIEEISRLTYNYFNPDAPLYQRRDPILPYTAIDCVTVSSPDEVDLNDINKNRLDANGNPLSTACYGGAGKCHPFDDWGRAAQ